MRDPQIGDIVDIFFKGVRVIDAPAPPIAGYGPGVFVAVLASDGHSNTHTLIRWKSPNVTVTVVEPATPAEWPPRQGDLWRDRDGDLWFGIGVRDFNNPGTRLVELVAAGGGSSTQPDEVHRVCGPLSLVHREGSDQR